jgi:hypothetical protein
MHTPVRITQRCAEFEIMPVYCVCPFNSMQQSKRSNRVIVRKQMEKSHFPATHPQQFNEI